MILKDFDLVSSMINCSSVLMEDEEKKRSYIKDWLTEKIESNGIINSETTLVEIYKSLTLFFNFILLCRSE